MRRKHYVYLRPSGSLACDVCEYVWFSDGDGQCDGCDRLASLFAESDSEGGTHPVSFCFMCTTNRHRAEVAASPD